jgi:CRISPR-associated protein Csm1
MISPEGGAMESLIWNAAIAGLLHDIGKLEQRARLNPWTPAPGIEREGQPVHATWTIYFVQNNVPPAYRPAALAGAYHHAPEKSPAEDKRLSELIALADKLSAGERADPIEETQDKLAPPRQMVTIFDRLKAQGKTREGGWHYLPLREITLDMQSIFPTGRLTQEQEIDAYDHLCEVVRNAARQYLPDPSSYLENLLGVLQRATWCVPSAYYHSVPDVSLYDHNRMTAALAVCLAKADANQIHQLLGAVQRNFWEKAEDQDTELLQTPVAMLVGGDISGVQSFIYTISSKGAAKTLRGRSFYLQLLTEAVLRYVLNELEIPYTNVIYSGGGHFYLLAPPDAADKLTRIRQSVTRKLLKHHKTSLYLALGYTEVPASGLRIGQFPKFWGDMHRELARAKQQRYRELGEELYQDIFAPQQYGGNPNETCSVCGGDTRPVTDWEEERQEEARICSLCRSFVEQIGKPLPDTRFIALGSAPPVDAPVAGALAVLEEFGISVQLLKSAGDQLNLPGASKVCFWSLDDPGNNRFPQSGKLPTANLLRYTLKKVPKSTFDELQKEVKGGFERLGALRMDVDNLGDIFSRGFGEPGASDNLATLARLSTLSFQISLFFEGWVKELCERQPDLIYPVYAGGDDLFLIGPWDIMPELAMQIRKDFAEFTGGHPALHLSGGMAFIGGKYPVYQAAKDAEEAEKLAKRLPGKNAFGFLGQAWQWQVFESISEKHHDLQKIVASKEINIENLEGPQAILQVLRQFAAQEADEAKRMKGRPVWGPWLWLGPYQLTRMAKRQKNKPELEAAIKSLRDELEKNNYGEINQWGAAARWTQLETRKSHNEKED